MSKRPVRNSTRGSRMVRLERALAPLMGDAIVGPARTALRPITVSVAADGSVTYTR